MQEDGSERNPAGSPGLLEEVRSGCRAVAEQAEQVRIHYQRLPDYADSLLVDKEAPAGDDPARRRSGTDEETVAFIATLDSINFVFFVSSWLKDLSEDSAG